MVVGLARGIVPMRQSTSAGESLTSSALRLDQCAAQAKPDIRDWLRCPSAVGTTCRQGHAERYRHDLGTVSPGAAAQHLLLALGGALRVVLGGTAVVVAVVPVARAFPDAAVDRVQTVAV